MRVTCEGSRRLPVVPNDRDDRPDASRMTLTSTVRTDAGGTYTVHHAPEYGLCPVCHETRRLLKCGELPKHDRYLNYRQQVEAGLRPDPNVGIIIVPTEVEFDPRQAETAAYTETAALDEPPDEFLVP